MKILRLISRIVIGVVFIFSGTVKAIDPLGSAYKFHDYFIAFHLQFLDFLSLPLAILLCTAEFIAGFSVLAGIKNKGGIWLVMILMGIFTPLTLVLALTNPVSDCGCFGDALHLTNWETFGKNVILLFLTLILFAGRKQMKSLSGNLREWMIISTAILLFILFSVYNLIYLPVIDFLPYKTGTKIAEKMIVPEGAQPDIYETTFIYEKNGVRKEFSLNDYPANDSTWVFADQKSVLVKKGYVPPIHDFSISTINGADVTQEILNNKGSTLLMISKKMEEASEKHLEKGFETGRYCFEKGISFIPVTASGSDKIKSYSDKASFFSADETTLKTMVRSNPGYILITDGVITGKWSWANLPDKEWFGKLDAQSSGRNDNK